MQMTLARLTSLLSVMVLSLNIFFKRWFVPKILFDRKVGNDRFLSDFRPGVVILFTLILKK